MIVLPLRRKTPRINNSSTLRGSNSSKYERIPPSSKRKSIAEESKIIKYTRQMALQIFQ